LEFVSIWWVSAKLHCLKWLYPRELRGECRFWINHFGFNGWSITLFVELKPDIDRADLVERECFYTEIADLHGPRGTD
jgi:hypothetical protein